ncbi:hypothetical protein LTR53_006895 [Teratosphaeriaceae sp. CCFEE 6253]|nr:hypothetical protein LTR53_006895 [Teratosphaeriaceae sp. CCFEE 6253]
MAIFLDVSGMEITIDVAGKDLLEYDDDENDPADTATVSKYVEAVSGAEFGIAFRFKPGEYPFGDDRIEYNYYVDGTCAKKQTHRLKNIRSGHRMVKHGAVRESHNTWVSQAMLFSELTVGDDPPDARLIDKLGDLGTIQVKCYRVHSVPVAPVPPKPERKAAVDLRPAQLIPDGRISEKNLKGMALTHQATMGPAVPIQVPSGPIRPATHRLVRRDGGTVANFVFKYRSRSALQTLHVIPRTPTPVPLEERPVDELSMEEMRELLRRQRASEALNTKQEVKRERHTAFDVDEEDAIEVVSHRNKKTRMSDAGHSGIEVIDLCGD